MLKLFDRDNKEAITKLEFLTIIVFFVIASLWAIYMPETYAPDERMRFLIPKFIYAHNSLPLPDDPEVIYKIYDASYAYYPFFIGPICSAIFMKIASIFGITGAGLLVAARFTSVISGALFVYFLIKIAKRLFKNQYTKWFAIILGTTIPQFMFLSSYVNNDSLALMASAMMVLGWICGIQDKWNFKNATLLAIGIIICALSYYNAYAWILTSMIMFVVSFINKENEEKVKLDYKNMLKYGIFISVIVLIGIGFFFIRNYIVTDGDLLGIDAFLNACEEGAEDFLKPSNRETPKNLGMPILEMFTTLRYHQNETWITNTYKSFVCTLGKMVHYIASPVYIFYGIIFAIGIIGMIIHFFKILKGNYKMKVFYINLLISFIVPIFLSIRYSYATDYQPQGRYIYPLWMSLIIFTTTGVEFLLSKIKFLENKEKLKKGLFIGVLIIFLIITIIANYLYFTSIIK